MDPSQVLDWTREALRVALLLGGPPLLAALVISLVVGMGQTVTQLHDPAVGLIPRLVGVVLVIMLVLPWLLGVWVSYAAEVFGSVPDWI
jgi:flagellar biosynthesis protein FliQ